MQSLCIPALYRLLGSSEHRLLVERRAAVKYVLGLPAVIPEIRNATISALRLQRVQGPNQVKGHLFLCLRLQKTL